MAEQLNGLPAGVFSEETRRTSGKDALSMNIEAGSAVAEAVRTTLGPRGMDKMLVSEDGDVVVTNDGVTVLSEMDVDHPVAEMVVDVAETQDAEVGDGTTTAVVVAGALLEEASELTERGIHPSTVVDGYRRAAEHVPTLLDDVAVEASPDDTELLESIARTALAGKGAEAAVDELAPLVVEAVRRTVDESGPDVDAIKVHSFPGKTIGDSRLLDGLTIDRTPDHPNMEADRDDAEILVYGGELKPTESEVDPEIEVSDPGELEAFIERERAELDNVAEGIADAGVDVVFASGEIGDRVQQRLAEAGVLSFGGVRDPDVEKLVATTGASVVSDFGGISESDLGYAGTVREELIRAKYGPKSAAPEKTTLVSDLEEVNAFTFVLRGATEHVVDEVDRAVEDALQVVAATIEDGLVVPGGGAAEVALALGLRDAADAVDSREQLAIEAVADALETIPRTLAANGGLDPVDALVDVRASQEGGDEATGIDTRSGEVVDAHEAGILEPKRVKSQALDAGIEAVNSVLRIDDVVSAGELKTDDDEDDEDTGLNPYS